MNQKSHHQRRAKRHVAPERYIANSTPDVDALFEANLPRLTHVALRVLRHREDSEDAVQDGLLSAFTHLDQFRGQARFSTWLHSIIVNSALIKFRRQKSRPTTSLDEMTANDGEGCPALLIADSRPDSEQTYARREQFHMLADAIEHLPKIHRLAVRLCNIEGLRTEDAAQELGISVPALKTRLFRARWLIANHIRLTHAKRQFGRRAASDQLQVPSDRTPNTFNRRQSDGFQCAAD